MRSNLPVTQNEVKLTDATLMYLVSTVAANSGAERI